MKWIKHLMLVMSVFSFSLGVHAESPAVPVAIDTTTQNTVSTSNTSDTYEDAARDASKVTNDGSSKGKQMVVIALGIAAAFYAAQQYKQGHKFTAIAIVGLSIVAAMSATSSKNKKIADTFTVGQTGTSGSDGSNGSDGNSGLADNGGDGYEEINNGIDNLRQYGVEIDQNKGTMTIKGKTYSAKDYASPAAMAAAGMSDSEIQAFQAAVNQVAKEADAKVKAADAVAGYEDGGSGGSTSAAAAADESYGGGLAAKQKYSVNRDPSNVAGLSKMLNGEPIGVANDGLFSMITRRYGVEQKKGAFIGPVKP